MYKGPSKMTTLSLCIVLQLFALPVLSETCTCPDSKCPTQVCPSDGNWINHFGSCYRFLDESHFTHLEAARYCFLIHADVVSIDSKEEDTFIQDIANRLFKYPTNQNATFWTGGFHPMDRGHEEHWQWYAGDQYMPYTNWFPGQPDNLDPKLDDCMALVGAYNFTWHDVPCGEHHHSICEIRLDNDKPIIG